MTDNITEGNSRFSSIQEKKKDSCISLEIFSLDTRPACSTYKHKDQILFLLEYGVLNENDSHRLIEWKDQDRWRNVTGVGL